MIRNLIATTLVLISLVGMVGGCQKMGKATGQAADQVEEGAQDFKQGYEEGKKE
ncbi:MAG: hypothetical protein WBY88_17520 [Desulfosarcina sp.]